MLDPFGWLEILLARTAEEAAHPVEDGSGAQALDRSHLARRGVDLDDEAEQEQAVADSALNGPIDLFAWLALHRLSPLGLYLPRDHAEGRRLDRQVDDRLDGLRETRVLLRLNEPSEDGRARRKATFELRQATVGC